MHHATPNPLTRIALACLLACAQSSGHATDAANATVSAGTGSVSTSGAVTTINQSSQRLAIDWSRLSTSASEALVFKQPGASSIALNRVTGSDPSQLLGSLSANGQVFILNPNGVLFGAGSQVNAAGIVASTLSLGNDDFMAGRYSFANGGSSGSVVNRGTITTSQGGYVALLAPEVRNEGVIRALLGNALLAAGNRVTLQLDNGSLLGYSIDQGAVNALAENRQLIQADGGQVVLTASALDALATAAVNNTGVIEAQTVDNKAGRILLLGDMHRGVTNVAGTLDVSAPNGGNGGFIETSAFQVKTDESARISMRAPRGKSGSLLVDPDTFTVNNGGADSGSVGTASFYSNTYLGSLLEGGSVTIATTGGANTITINGGVTWGSDSTLALQTTSSFNCPTCSIAINAPLTFNSGTLSLFTNGTISAPAAIRGNILSLQAGTWNTVAATLPVLQLTDFRFADNSFVNGSFIRALGGNGTPASPYQLTDIYGVQGMAGNSLGRSFVLANDINAAGTRNWYTDAGTGVSAGFRTTEVAFTGSFDGQGHVINNLSINRPGENAIGLFASMGGSAQNVGLANVSIRGGGSVGGLAGNNNGAISGAWVSGSVNGTSRTTGGLVGNNGGTITGSYSSASVNGGDTGDTGGLVGENHNSIADSYATGSVNGAGGFHIGGLVGYNYAAISNSYATGRVQNGGYLGGLVGFSVNSPAVSVTSSYWDMQTSGLSTSDAGAGKTTAQMMQASTFAGWSMSTDGNPATATTWRIYEGHTAPLLRGFLTPQALGSSTTVYDGSLQSAATPPAGPTVFGTAAAGIDAGTYTSDWWSSQRGYDIRNNTLTISPRPLDVTGSRAYDGTTVFQAGDLALGNLVGGQTLSLSGSASVASADAGAAAQALANTGGLSIADGTNGGLASNYVLFAQGSASTGMIGRRVLTLGGGRVYDGTTLVSASGLMLGNLVGSETLALGGSATIDNKNAGTHTTIGTGGLTLADGADGAGGGKASNYTLAGGSASIDIGRRTLNVTTTGVNKVYDGTTDATVTTGSDKLAGDSLAISYALASFDSKNAGTRAINVSGIGVSGDDAGNYTLAFNSAATSANITPRTLAVTANDDRKSFDGLRYSGGNGVSFSGFVAGDGASDIGGSVNYGGSSQGAYLVGSYAITPSGLSSRSGNYSLAYAGGTLSITPAVPYLNFQGLASLMDAYDCALQGVSGLAGLFSRQSAGCLRTQFNARPADEED